VRDVLYVSLFRCMILTMEIAFYDNVGEVICIIKCSSLYSTIFSVGDTITWLITTDKLNFLCV